MEVLQILSRYNEKCSQFFRNPKEINSAQRNDPDKLPEEYPMKYVVRSIKNLPDKFWTSIELHEFYKVNRREQNKCSRFLTKLITHMKNELYVFTSPGLAGIVILKEKASLNMTMMMITMMMTMMMMMMIMIMFQCNILQKR